VRGPGAPERRRREQPGRHGAAAVQRTCNPNERVGADAHLFDVIADGAAFASYVLPNVLRCAHWGAHDAEALYLDYIKVVHEHGAEGLKGARLVSVDTITFETSWLTARSKLM
jgi:hypothetical protein